jgi:hypothetical protein
VESERERVRNSVKSERRVKSEEERKELETE